MFETLIFDLSIITKLAYFISDVKAKLKHMFSTAVKQLQITRKCETHKSTLKHNSKALFSFWVMSGHVKFQFD